MSTIPGSTGAIDPRIARQRLDREANVAARFLPQRDDDESPAIDLAGVLGIMHVRDGELYVNVGLDTADPAVYRTYGDQRVPLHIAVDGDTVFESADPQALPVPGRREQATTPKTPTAVRCPGDRPAGQLTERCNLTGRRFEFREATARALVARAVRRHAGAVRQPGQACYEDLELEPGWNPRRIYHDEMALAEYLVDQAIAADAIRCPEGMCVDLHCRPDSDGGTYAWRVRVDTGFTLGSEYWAEMRRLGDGSVGGHGALAVLREAVTAANEILAAYERSARRLLAAA
jgi:hypothetical protein